MRRGLNGRQVHFVVAQVVALLFCAVTAIPTTAQTLTTLVSFNDANGAEPNIDLVQGRDGNFYGMTGTGGANNAGTVFKVTPTGILTTLYNFCSQLGCTDGINTPLIGGGLVLATD